MTTQATQATPISSTPHVFTQSFDSRLLSWGAVGIGALIVAAFLSLAAPRFTGSTARGYDAAGSSRWPMS
jgi:hypothetical protein